MASHEEQAPEPSPVTPEVVAVLRQLATGLGVYRLYDGGEVAAVAEAAQRIAAAVEAALATGGCEVTVAGGTFPGAPRGEHLDRLAAALFERRVEHLRIAAVPRPAELAALFAALSEEPHAVEVAGGVQPRLEAAGVRSVTTSEDVPDPSSGEEATEQLLVTGDTEVEEQGPADLALALEMLPEQDAGVLFEKLRGVAARLPERTAARSPFYREVAVLAAALPPVEQPRFERMLLDGAADDAFAEHALSHLTDVALADLIVRVARHEGVDPRPLATEVMARGQRHANLSRLVLERRLSRNRSEDGAGSAPGADPGDPVAGAPGPPSQAGGDRDLVAVEYGDELAAGYDELIAAEATVAEPVAVEDLVLPGGARLPGGPSTHPLAVAFPGDAAAGRAIAATTLVDLLRNRPREEHLLGLCAAMERQLRTDVAEGRVGEVQQLLDAWRRGAALVEPAIARQLEEVIPRVMDVEVVVAALDADPGAVRALLEPFGRSAIAPLVAALEPYRPDGVRRTARRVLTALVGDHLDAVGEAVAPRSAEARRQVVATLAGVTAPGVASTLGRIAQHRDVELQLEVLDALTGIDPARAAPVIGGIIARSRQRAVQRRGLEVLAAGQAPASRDLLRRLGERGSSPLPGGLRRRARRLAGG